MADILEAVDIKSGKLGVVKEGAEFYMKERIDPDAKIKEQQDLIESYQKLIEIAQNAITVYQSIKG